MSVSVAQQDRDEKLWPGPVSELLCPSSQTSVQLLTVDHLLWWPSLENLSDNVTNISNILTLLQEHIELFQISQKWNDSSPNSKVAKKILELSSLNTFCESFLKTTLACSSVMLPLSHYHWTFISFQESSNSGKCTVLTLFLGANHPLELRWFVRFSCKIICEVSNRIWRVVNCRSRFSSCSLGPFLKFLITSGGAIGSKRWAWVAGQINPGL